jgi:hypothetical protein
MMVKIVDIWLGVWRLIRENQHQETVYPKHLTKGLQCPVRIADMFKYVPTENKVKFQLGRQFIKATGHVYSILGSQPPPDTCGLNHPSVCALAYREKIGTQAGTKLHNHITGHNLAKIGRV